MPGPLIFVSHKHADRAIANVVRSFVTEQTRSKVRVFQSSDPTAVTPGVGRTLNTDLREALWGAAAVILVYTAPDQDWGYCMWECGVATLPNSPDTRIILLQCGESAPSLFQGQFGVNARNKLSVQTFVTQFMTAEDFLPRSSEALTGYPAIAPEVQQAANKFFDDLQAVLPEGPSAEWPAHPYAQFQLSVAAAKAITEAPAEDKEAVRRKTVLTEATVSDSDKDFQALFGLAAIDGRLTLKMLLDIWRTKYPKRSEGWMEAITDQLGQAAQGQFPALKWTPMPAVRDGRLHAPVLTRVRKIPSMNSLQFDVYFYPFNLMSATPVQSRMVRRDDMLCRVLSGAGESSVGVLSLLDELDEHKFSRLPFLDQTGRLVYIAHRSTLDQFVSRRARSKQPVDATVTLADVFEQQPDIKTMFSTTAAFLPSEATMADAKLAMDSLPNCYDVFITDTGNSNDQVVGWLTDVIIRASAAVDS
jgi:hypothetical protein